MSPKSLQRSRPALAPLRLDSISECPENQRTPFVNLGAETPTSILKPSVTPPSPLAADEWSKSGIAVNTTVPARRRSWRSNSWSAGRSKGMARFQKEKLDTDCGICFEPAINPRKVLCCRQCFCFDHLMDWLSSNAKCPGCDGVCSPPLSPSASTARLPITPPMSPVSPAPPSLRPVPSPPPPTATISFEGYQIRSITTVERELPPSSFSPLSSLIIGIVSGRTPLSLESLGLVVGNTLMLSALLLFICAFLPPVL